MAPAGSGLVMGREREFYTNEPPGIVIRRWLLDSDAAAGGEAPAELLDALRESLTVAADERWWETEVATLAAPGLARAVARSKQSDAQLILLVSRLGRIVTGYVDGGSGVGFSSIVDSGCRPVVVGLAASGWRFVPHRWLKRPYDGADAELRRRSVTWWERLLGDTPQPYADGGGCQHAEAADRSALGRNSTRDARFRVGFRGVCRSRRIRLRRCFSWLASSSSAYSAGEVLKGWDNCTVRPGS